MPVVALPESGSQVKLTFDCEQELTEERYVAFCQANPDLRVERSAEAEIIIVPPPGGESDYRSNDIAGELRAWAKRDGRGKGFGSSAQFILPDGSALSPDAAWVSNESLTRLTRQQRKEFLRLCPEFVVEVLSPSDRLKRAMQKMEQWIANGAQLAWLIDGDAQTVYIYRPAPAAGVGVTAQCAPAEIRQGIKELAGEGPIEGFTLQLQSIWDGLG
jgi:Uma2 family endonuclease